MEPSIRKAEIKDAREIAELSGQLGYVSLEASMQNRLVEALKSNTDCVFVAVLNKEVIGWIHGFYSLRLESDPFVEIGGLVVSAIHRKLGIGKKLVEHVMIWARQYECEKMKVRVNVVRKESHRFYENNGFVLSKEQKVFDKELPETAGS